MKHLIFLFLTVLFISSASHAQNVDLEGEWTAVSPNTRGLTRVVVTSDGEGSFVEAWGRCHPQDCEWGRTLLTPVGKGVEDRSFKSGFAIWEPGFASKYVMFSLDRRMLRVETVTVFRDRSRRSSYRSIEYLRRVEEPEP